MFLRDSFWGITLFLPPIYKRKGGAPRSESKIKRLPGAIAPLLMTSMYVTWNDLFQCCTFVVAVINLVLLVNNNKKR